MLEKLDNLIFGRGKLIVYIVGIFLIIYFDKWDLDKVLRFVFIIGQLTIIWCVIKILRIYLINYVQKLNRFIYTNFSIIIKLRRYLFDIPLILRMFLSLFIYIDMFLIKILFLETRKRNLFYFLRRLIYLNLLIWLSLPFYFIKELYNIILTVIESNEIKISDVLWARAHFLLLTIICVLLIDIERINFLIAAWVIDTVLITIYYEWFKEYKQMYQIKEFNFRIIVIKLHCAFYQVRMNYNEYSNSLIENEGPLRRNVLLIYKGLGKEEQELCKIKIIELFIEKYKNWWNFYYVYYEFDRSSSFEYFDSVNDDHFILFLLIKVAEIAGVEKDGIVNINEINLYEALEETFDKRFHPIQYKLVLEVLQKIKKNNKLLIEFFELKEKYEFNLYDDYSKEEKVKDFLKKLNL